MHVSDVVKINASLPAAAHHVVGTSNFIAWLFHHPSQPSTLTLLYNYHRVQSPILCHIKQSFSGKNGHAQNGDRLEWCKLHDSIIITIIKWLEWDHFFPFLVVVSIWICSKLASWDWLNDLNWSSLLQNDTFSCWDCRQNLWWKRFYFLVMDTLLIAGGVVMVDCFLPASYLCSYGVDYKKGPPVSLQVLYWEWVLLAIHVSKCQQSSWFGTPFVRYGRSFIGGGNAIVTSPVIEIKSS